MNFAAIIHAMTADGQDTLPLPEALATLRACGFDAVMLMSVPGRPALTAASIPDACLLDLARSDAGLVARICADAGISVAGVYGSGIDPASEDRFDQGIANLRAVCAVAGELGCRHVAHPGGRAPAPGLGPEAKLPLVRRLGRIVDAVASEFAQMCFAVDVHYHGTIESVADCERYLSELNCERAGVLLNTGHMTTCAQPGWELLERHPERVPVIGWKDHRPDPEGKRPFLSVQLGTGETPLGRYLEAACQDDRDRLHVINVENVPIEQKPQALRASLRHMRALCART
ncbi:MAG: sugar phosphate isomerase/epimerase family protein [Armatimonadota bacterium]